MRVSAATGGRSHEARKKRKVDDASVVADAEKGFTELDELDLSNLKAQDPSFYKFLRDNDSELFKFAQRQAEDAVADGGGDDDAEEDLEEPHFGGTTEPLTIRRIQLLASKWLVDGGSSLKLRQTNILVQMFRCAVAAHYKTAPTVGAHGLKPKKDKLDKADKVTAQFLPFSVADEDTPDVLLEVFSLLAEHADLIFSPLAKMHSRKAEIAFREDGVLGDDNATATLTFGVPKVQHGRSRTILAVFWRSVTTILTGEIAADRLESVTTEKKTWILAPVLRALQDPSRLLRWLEGSDRTVRRKFTTALTRVWLATTADTDVERLGADSRAIASLVVLRALSKMWAASFLVGAGRPRGHAEAKEAPLEGGSLLQQEVVEILLLGLLHAGHGGYRSACGSVGSLAEFRQASWRLRSVGSAEILIGSHKNVCYRAAFHTVQALAQIVRENLMLQSKKVSDAHAAAKAAKELICLPFLATARALIVAIGRQQADLALLTFPLSGVLTAATQLFINRAVAYSGFLLSLLELQIALTVASQTFIPVGSFLVTIGLELANKLTRVETAISHNLKESQNSNGQSPMKESKPSRRARKTGIAAFDIAPEGHKLSLSQTHATRVQLRLQDSSDPDALTHLLCLWTNLCIDYLTLISRHPAFPEVSFPFLVQLKRIGGLRNDLIRGAVKGVVSASQTIAQEVQKRRITLDPVTVAGPKASLFVLPPSDKLLPYKFNLYPEEILRPPRHD